MFKIPTYDELEKKESDFNDERQKYTTFAKRKSKNDDSENYQEPSSLNSDTQEKTKESPAKKMNTTDSSNFTEQITNKPIEKDIYNDDDDDDELLNMFIKENKDIIENPSSQKRKSKEFQVPTIPAIPALPVPVKFDPKIKLQRAEFIQGNAPSKSSGSSSSLIVNASQRGNLVLKHIRNVQWKFCDQITPDFQMSYQMCAFFLSMKYHLLNATYIHKRIKEIGRAYNVRVLLALVDVKEPRHCIKELEKIAIFSNLSLILCWSNEEVARYLETFKAYEFKSAETIMEKATVTAPGQVVSDKINPSDINFVNSITDFLCQIKSINKTDASTLRQTYGSIKQLSMSSKDQLNFCPGLGPLKVNRLHSIFKIPFLIDKTQK